MNDNVMKLYVARNKKEHALAWVWAANIQSATILLTIKDYGEEVVYVTRAR